MFWGLSLNWTDTESRSGLISRVVARYAYTICVSTGHAPKWLTTRFATTKSHGHTLQQERATPEGDRVESETNGTEKGTVGPHLEQSKPMVAVDEDTDIGGGAIWDTVGIDGYIEGEMSGNSSGTDLADDGWVTTVPAIPAVWPGIEASIFTPPVYTYSDTVANQLRWSNAPVQASSSLA
eukprot:6515872-Pyramimonas_sp.AAC.1